jgi:zinc transport system substrate-binding protein
MRYLTIGARALAIAMILLPVALISQVSSSQASESPKVVVTILPLHSIAAAVMEGRGKPEMLLSANLSPHDFSLRPSQARGLSSADLVVWAGPAMESGLQKIMVSLENGGRLATLLDVPYLTLHASREGGLWENDHEDSHDEGHEHTGNGTDPHMWLDPENGRIIANYLAQRLEQIDPEYGPLYRRNANAFSDRLTAAQKRMAAQLAPLAERPYLVTHDAFQYFEQRFGLAALGSLAISPEQAPGAKRVLEIREFLLAKRALCVFAEPQFQPKVLETLLSGTEVRQGRLDPLGADLTPGAEAYLQLLEQMTADLAACLGS